MNKIIIVTVNFNTEKDTRSFLDSITDVEKENFILETIVVDNGSKVPFKLKTHEKNVKLIRSESNTGFAGGYNIGMKQALKDGADYVLIINNDTIIEKHMVGELLAGFSLGQKIGITTPKIYFAKGHEFHKHKYATHELGKVFWYAGGYTDWANIRSVHRGVDEVDKGQYDTPEKVTFASGCCMMFSKEVIQKVGFFDERFFLYYEDADMNERVQRAGYSIYYIPRAVLVHVNAASSGGAGNPLQDYFITRNQMLFGMHYAPLRSKFALLRQSIRVLYSGRVNQKKAIWDYYKGNLGRGSYL